MMINWKVRIKNKQFWLSFVPAVLLLVQAVAALCGAEVQLDVLQQKLLAVIDAVFLVLATMGVVVDPTTEGIQDSERAMGYEEPWPVEKEKPPEGGNL